MMDFVLLTLSITVSLLLASGAALVLCTSKPVLKWYMKKVNKITEQVINETFKDGDL